eukprot:341763_1
MEDCLLAEVFFVWFSIWFLLQFFGRVLDWRPKIITTDKVDSIDNFNEDKNTVMRRLSHSIDNKRIFRVQTDYSWLLVVAIVDMISFAFFIYNVDYNWCYDHIVSKNTETTQHLWYKQWAILGIVEYLWDITMITHSIYYNCDWLLIIHHVMAIVIALLTLYDKILFPYTTIVSIFGECLTFPITFVWAIRSLLCHKYPILIQNLFICCKYYWYILLACNLICGAIYFYNNT